MAGFGPSQLFWYVALGVIALILILRASKK
jgi:hypothetical protein